MKMLIIYDNGGTIIKQSNDMTEPLGIPFKIVEVPKDCYIKRMDVSVSVKDATPIFINANTPNIDNMSFEELKSYYISKSKQNLADYFKTATIISECHGLVGKEYSINEDKQNRLTQMISMTMLAIQMKNTLFKPSWNATGESCDYTWTLTELQQLAFEMEAVVRPLVSKQQEVENKIKECTTKEAVLAINIAVTV
jgi:hypothetical protein